ncbi:MULTISPECIES: hypothetical protein [unclassified Phenylobacterium]|jgi:hypothetical protein|uniref:hypothetical protein n=1 Tax=unclassified Phenylobacterium TaxID=2640670 RepID=UPI000B1BCD06|nr:MULTISPECIES: hypothetical protein [unclassified Phenylobacterium]
MADRSSSSTMVWLAILIGALVLGIGAIGYAVVSRQAQSDLPKAIDVDINVPRPPSLPDAPKMPDAPLPAPR